MLREERKDKKYDIDREEQNKKNADKKAMMEEEAAGMMPGMDMEWAETVDTMHDEGNARWRELI